MKKLANIITYTRIIASIVLLFLKTFSLKFNILYLYAGFTDMIDGFVARKTKSESKQGAILDSIADICFVLVCFYKVLTILHIDLWIIVFVLLIALIRIINILIGYIKHNELVLLHTKLNKLTGFLLYLLPISINWLDY